MLFVLAGVGVSATESNAKDFEIFKSSSCNGNFVSGNDLLNTLCRQSDSKQDFEDQMNYLREKCSLGRTPDSPAPLNSKATAQAVKTIDQFYGSQCSGILSSLAMGRGELKMYFAGVANATCNSAPPKQNQNSGAVK